MRRGERRNNLQICPRRDSNMGGSDLWSSTLPLDHGGAPRPFWTSMRGLLTESIIGGNDLLINSTWLPQPGVCLLKNQTILQYLKYETVISKGKVIVTILAAENWLFEWICGIHLWGLSIWVQAIRWCWIINELLNSWWDSSMYGGQWITFPL